MERIGNIVFRNLRALWFSTAIMYFAFFVVITNMQRVTSQFEGHSSTTMTGAILGHLSHRLNQVAMDSLAEINADDHHSHERLTRVKRQTDVTVQPVGRYSHSYIVGSGVGNRFEVVVDDVGSSISRIPLDPSSNIITIPASATSPPYLIISSGGETTLYQLDSDGNTNDLISITAAGLLSHFTISSNQYVTITKADEVEIYLLSTAGTNATADLNLLQTIPTDGAQIVSVRHFTSGGGKNYLVLISSGADTDSYVYDLKEVPPTQIEEGHFSRCSSLTNPEQVKDAVIFVIYQETFLLLTNDGDPTPENGTFESVLYRFDDVRQIFLEHQRIPTSGVLDVEYVNILGHRLLLLVTRDENVEIYRWNPLVLPAVFVAYETITEPLITSLSLIHLPTCLEQPLLITSTSLSTGSAYTVDASNQITFQKTKIDVSGTVVGWYTPPTKDYEGPVFLILSDSSFISIHQLNYSIQPVRDSIQRQLEELQAKIDSLKVEITVHEDELGLARDSFLDAVPNAGSHLVSGQKRIDGELISSTTISVDSLQLDSYNIATSDAISGDGFSTVSSLEDRLGDSNDKITQILEDLDDLVDISTGSHTITGDKTFIGEIILENTVVQIKDLNVEYFGDFDVGDRMERAITKDHSGPVSGDKTFLLDVTSDHLSVGSLDGLRIPDDVVLTDRSQIISGIKTINGDVVTEGDVDVTGLVNNVLDVDHLIQLNKVHQEILGEKVFTDEIHINSDVEFTSTFDGVNVTHLLSNVFTQSTIQTITGTYTFSANTNFSGHINLPTGSVNDVDISGLSQRCVRSNQPTTLLSRKYFDNVLTVTGDIVTLGLVDGVLPSDLFLRHSPQTVTSPTTFTRGLEVKGRTGVTGTINGIDINNDLVTLTGDEDDIFGTWRFLSPTQFTNIHPTGLVDEVDISIYAANRLIVDGGGVIPSYVTLILQSPVEVKDLQVVTLNSVDVDEILQDLVYLNELGDKVVRLDGDKSFKSLTVNGETVITGLVSGRNFPADFLEIHGGLTTPLILTTPVIHRDKTTFTTLLVAGDVDGVSISELNDMALSSDTSAEFMGNINFVDEIEIRGAIVVSGSYNEIDVANIMVTNKEQDINVPLHFTSLSVTDKLTVSSEFEVSKTVNGWELQEFSDRVYDLRSNQVITADYTFLQPVVLTQNLQVTSTLNEVDISSLPPHLLSLTRPKQIISAYWKFIPPSGLVVLNDATVASGIVNNLDIGMLNREGVRLNEENEFSGDIVFVDSITIDGRMRVDGLIDGQDIKHLNNDLIRETSSTAQIITGPKYLESGLFVEGNLDITNTVDEKDLDKDLLLRSQSNRITAPYTFSQLTVDGDVISGPQVTFNHIDIDKLDEDSLKIDGPNIVTGRATFANDVEIIEDIVIEGTIDGIVLDSMMDSCIRLDKDVTFPQPTSDVIVFTGNITSNGDIRVGGDTNGKDLSQFVDTIIYIDEDIVIPEDTLTFTGTLTVPDTLRVEGAVEVKGTLCNHHIDTIFSDAFYTNRDLEINVNIDHAGLVEFVNNVTLGGSINGIDMSTDVLLRHACGSAGSASPSAKFLSSSEFLESLSAGDGSSGSGEDESGDTDMMILNADESVEEEGSPRRGVIIPTSLTGGTPVYQEVTGRYTFSDLTLLANINTRSPSVEVNGHRLGEVEADTVKVGEPVEVGGTKILEGSISFMSDINVLGLVNGHDKEEFVRLDGDYEINGEIEVTPEVTTHILGDVKADFVNDGDLNRLCKQAFYTDGEVVNVVGKYVFAGKTTFSSSIILSGLLNGGIDVKVLLDMEQSLLRNLSTGLNLLESEVESTCTELDLFHSVLESSQYVLHYFRETYGGSGGEDLGLNHLNHFSIYSLPHLDSSTNVTKSPAPLVTYGGLSTVLVDPRVSDLFLVESSGTPWGLCSPSDVFQWVVQPDDVSGEGRFTLTSQITHSGLSRLYHPLTINSQHYLVYIDFQPGYCNGVSHSVLLYNTSSLQYDLLQPLRSGNFRYVDSLVISEDEAYIILSGSFTTPANLYKFDSTTKTFIPLISAVFAEQTAGSPVKIFKGSSGDEIFIAFGNSQVGFFLESLLYTLDKASGEVSLYQTFMVDTISDISHFSFRHTDYLMFVVDRVALASSSSSTLSVKIFYQIPEATNFSPYQTLIPCGDGREGGRPLSVELFEAGWPRELYLAVVCRFRGVEIYQYKFASRFSHSLSIPQPGIFELRSFYYGNSLHLVAGVRSHTGQASVIVYTAEMLGVFVRPVQAQCDVPDVSVTFEELANDD